MPHAAVQARGWPQPLIWPFVDSPVQWLRSRGGRRASGIISCRMGFLDEALGYTMRCQGVWAATGGRIIDWYRSNPPVA
jgi:hypothetical protein